MSCWNIILPVSISSSIRKTVNPVLELLFNMAVSTGEGPLSSGNKLKCILKILLFELRKLGENIFAKLALIPISILL